MNNNTEAERLISEAFDGVDVDAMEDCPQGEACGVHNRVDEAHFEEDAEYGMMISYRGDYAVVTSDNPACEDSALLVRMLLGVISEEDIPPLYQTTVYYVGDKVLWDMHDMSVKERLERVRFISRHDDWDSFGSEHFDVVDMVEEGEVDLSKPVSEA